MIRARRGAPARLALALLLALGVWPAPGVAAPVGEGQEAPAGAASDARQDTADAATASAREDDGEQSPSSEGRSTAPTEFVLVKESLPYVPSSNTIATRLPLSLMLTPSNVGVVASPLLYEQDALVLSDALRNISGVNVQEQSGVHDFFVTRGFDSLSGGLVLTDGAAEPEATYHEMQNVERVELLKGPAGFLYGSNPLAGAVNIVRKQPLPVRFTDLGFSGGSFGHGEATVDLNLAGPEGDFRFRLNGLWREGDNYRDDKDSRDWGINPAFAWTLGPRSTLNLNLEYLDLERSPDGGLPLVASGGVVPDSLPDVDRRRSYQSPFDFSEQQVSRVQLDWESQVSDTVTLRDKVYYRGLDWTSDGTLLNGAFPDPNSPDFAVSRALTSLDDEQRFVGNQFEAVISLAAGSVRHDLLAGLEVARLTDQFALDVAPPCGPFAPPEPFCMPAIGLSTGRESLSARPIGFPFERGDSTTSIVAPYVVDQISFSKRWQALVGARLDVLDFEDDVRGSSRSDTEISPMAGVVFAPTATLSLYANAGEAFAPPSPRQVGDPEPEDSRQVELGVKKLFAGGRAQATWAVYQLERDNIGIPDENGFTQQDGDQRSRGFEFELAAEPLPRLRAFFSYAFNDAELTRFREQVAVGVDMGTGQPIFRTFDRSGNEPAFAPRHIANFWLSRRFANGFGVGGGGRYVAEQFIAEDNGFAIDDYTVFDAAFFYDRDQWRFKLNLKNLTDTDYERRGFPSIGVIPADPFTVFAGIELRL